MTPCASTRASLPARPQQQGWPRANHQTSPGLAHPGTGAAIGWLRGQRDRPAEPGPTSSVSQHGAGGVELKPKSPCPNTLVEVARGEQGSKVSPEAAGTRRAQGRKWWCLITPRTTARYAAIRPLPERTMRFVEGQKAGSFLSCSIHAARAPRPAPRAPGGPLAGRARPAQRQSCLKSP